MRYRRRRAETSAPAEQRPEAPQRHRETEMADPDEQLAQALWSLGERRGRLVWSDADRLRRALNDEADLRVRPELLDAVATAGGLGVPSRLVTGVNADTEVSRLRSSTPMPQALAEEAVLVWWTAVRSLAPRHPTPPPRAVVEAVPARRLRLARAAGLIAVILTVAGAAVAFNAGLGRDSGDARLQSVPPTAAPVTAPPSTEPTTTVPATAPPPPVGGDYVPVPPRRLVDTRSGLGIPNRDTGKRGVVTASVAGPITAPAAQIKAVVLEVTVVDPSRGGYLTAAPTGSTPSAVSPIAFSDGAPVAASLILSRVDAAGQVDLRLSEGVAAHVIVDLVGYFSTTPSATNMAVVADSQPAVLLDTRSGAALGAGASTDVTLPDAQAGSVLGVTATGATAPGYLTVYGGSDRPDVSAVNFGAGRDGTALSFVTVGGDHKVHVFNGSAAPVHVIVFEVAKLVTGAVPSPMLLDIDGTVAADGRSAPYPFRTVDSRGKATCPTTLGGGISNVSSVFPKAKALLLSVTAINATGPGFLTAYSAAAAPAVAALNYSARDATSGLTFVPVSGDRINLVCGAGGPEYLIDVIAAFE